MPDEQISVTPTDFRRLESKVDGLTSAIKSLVLIEERQSGHTERLDKGESRMDEAEKLARTDKATTDAEMRRIDARISKVLNVGAGAWTVVLIAFEFFRTFYKG